MADIRRRRWCASPALSSWTSCEDKDPQESAALTTAKVYINGSNFERLPLLDQLLPRLTSLDAARAGAAGAVRAALADGPCRWSSERPGVQ